MTITVRTRLRLTYRLYWRIAQGCRSLVSLIGRQLPYDQFSPDPNIVSQRLATLHRLPSLARGIVVVPVQTLMQQLAPLSYIVGGSFDFKVGQRLILDAEKQRLERAGYRNVPQVMDPGDFTVRGGCLMFIRWVRMYRCESNYWMRD